jgi:hypothetical protein
LHIFRPFSAGTLNVLLLFSIELFHGDRRPPSFRKGLPQTLQSQMMLLGAIVYLAEHHDGVTRKSGLPITMGGAACARAQADEKGRCDGPSAT